MILRIELFYLFSKYSIHVFKCFESTLFSLHIRHFSISSKTTYYWNNSKEGWFLDWVFFFEITNGSLCFIPRYNRFSSTLEHLSFCILVLIGFWYLWHLSFRLLFCFFFHLNLVPHLLQFSYFFECFPNHIVRLNQIARFLSSKSLNQTKLFLRPFSLGSLAHKAGLTYHNSFK